jgi:hypothetical protein
MGTGTQNKETPPGEDQIGYKIYKELLPKIVSSIIKMLNIIWDTGKLPKMWKNVIVIPILKPNKDQNDINSYRPISLTNNIM